MTRDDVREVLRRRAEELARPPSAVGRLEGGTHLVLPAGSERLAVPLEMVERVVALERDWTRLPSAPPHLPGVVNIRGRLMPLTDLLPFLGLPSQEPGEAAHGVVVTASGPEVLVPRAVLLCGARPREITVKSSALAGPPETLPEPARPFVVGVAPGLVTVLDLAGLLADPRILARPRGEGSRMTGMETGTKGETSCGPS